MSRAKPELVERLRYAAETASPAFAVLMSEAAAEIEDLRCVLEISGPLVSEEEGPELEDMETVGRA